MLFCAEPQTSREVDQDPEGGLTTQCNGGLCVFVLFLVYIFDHKTTVAGGAASAGGAGGALRAGASLVTVDVFTGHICSVSLFVFTCRRSETSTFGLCKAADVQRSGPGPGRRAHEAVQHQTQFLDHVLCLRNTVTSRRWLASSPSRSSPTPASLVKTRSRHTS